MELLKKLCGATAAGAYVTACWSRAVSHRVHLRPGLSRGGEVMDERRRMTMKTIINKFFAVFFVVACAGYAIAQDLASGPQLTVQIGHTGDVRSVAFSPDGRYVLSGSEDGTAKLWEVSTGREVRTLSGHRSNVTSVSISPDGRHGLSGSYDGTAKLWDLETGREIWSFSRHSRFVSSVAFSPDGRNVLTGSLDNTAKLWDVETGREVRTLTGHSTSVSSVAFSPDGRYVLTGSHDNTAKLWEVSTGREVRTFRGHSNEVTSISISPDGRYVLTGSGDQTAKLWEVSTGREVRTFSEHSRWVHSVAFSPDGRYALTGSNDNTARLWEVSTGREIRTFPGGPVLSVAFSPDGQYVLTGLRYNTAKMWDMGSGREVRTFSGYSNSVSSVAFSPDGGYALTGSFDPTANLWEVDSGRKVRTFSGHSRSVQSVAFSPDGRYMLTGSTDGTTKLWEVDAGREVRTFRGHSSYVFSVAFSPDGQYVLTGSWDRTAKLWEVDTGLEVRTFRGHSNWVLSVAFSPDGRYVLTGSEDRTAKHWEVDTGREVRTFSGYSQGVYSVAFSPDGRYALTGSRDNTAKLWEVDTGREVRTFRGFFSSVAFSPDGRYVLTGSWISFTANLWEVDTGREVRTFSGHSGRLGSVAFNPDGSHILTGSSDGTIRYWNTETGEQIYAAMSTLDGRSLTWTPEGYFSGDQTLAREAVYFVDGLRTIGIDQFFDQFYRPDIIEAKIAGRDITPLVTGPRTAAEAIVPLPEVSIEVERTAGTFRGLSVVGLGTPQAASADYHIVDGTVRVRVQVRDTGGGAEDIRLFHNGVRVSATTRGLAVVARETQGSQQTPGVVSQEFVIQLADGENTLRAIAFSSTRVESNPSVIQLTYQAPRRIDPTLWILSIGVNEHRNSRYNLNYAVADARSFVQAVQRSGARVFTDIRPTLLLDRQVTRDSIIQAFEAIARQAKPEDVFMFFFAGHGIALETPGATRPEFYFIPSDVTQQTDLAQVQSLGLSGPEFEQLVSQVPARKQLLVLDACNAGAITSAFGFRGAAEELALSRLSRSTGSALIAASREDQFAQEFAALGQGALTKALLDGLAGGAAMANGQITVGSLKSYVEAQMPMITQQHVGREQFPTGFVAGQDFPVGVR
jgi:WD40 repeat protein